MTILKSPARNLSYEEAVSALNSLQTNAITLKKTRKERQANVHLNLPITRKYLERSGMTLEDLDQLKIIHVSGTKGKGSTCAFSESILRHSGLKTGFYSSPHLVSVTERIRINGEPIDQVGRAPDLPPAETGSVVAGEIHRLLLVSLRQGLQGKRRGGQTTIFQISHYSGLQYLLPRTGGCCCDRGWHWRGI